MTPDISARGHWHRCFRRFHEDCDGATSTEYILIMATIILPLCAMVLFVCLPMVSTYGKRILSLIPLPFP